MKKFLCTVVVGCFLTGSLFARLGETRALCEERYGLPQTEEKSNGFIYAAYEKEGYIIGIVYTKVKNVDMAGLISFAKPNPGNAAYKKELQEDKDGFIDIIRTDLGRKQFTSEEIGYLLKANVQGKTWEWQKPKKKLKTWEPLVSTNKLQEIAWRQFVPGPNGTIVYTGTTAVYNNIYPHNLLVIRDPTCKDFPLEKKAEKSTEAPVKKKAESKLDGF